MSRKHFLATAFLLVGPACSCQSTDWGWVPGDAVFPARGLAVRREGAQQQRVIRFGHHSLSRPPGFKDYAGFFFLDVLGPSDALARGLADVSSRLEEPLYLVHNKGFLHHSSQPRLGVFFNESWMALPKQNHGVGEGSFAGGGPRAVYKSLIPSAEAVIHDWRFAADVDGLQVAVPVVSDWALPGRMKMQSLTIDVDRIVVFVVEKSRLTAAFDRSADAEILVVSHKGSVSALSYRKDGVPVLTAVD